MCGCFEEIVFSPPARPTFGGFLSARSNGVVVGGARGACVPEEHAGRQQVRAARQVVLHVQVVVAELRPDELGRGEYAHSARVRGTRVPRRPPDQLLARVEVGWAVGRALAQSAAHRLRVARHVRAVPADAQVPRAPRPLFAVPSAEA